MHYKEWFDQSTVSVINGSAVEMGTVCDCPGAEDVVSHYK